MSHPSLYPTGSPLISLHDLPLERPTLSRWYGMLESGETSIAPQDPAPLTKRSRKILNCEPCRNSKLKCDRNRPCSSCVLRGHASLCYSAEDKDPSTSPRGSPVASIDSPSMSTVNATSEFRKIRQSLSLLESHLTTLQRAPKPPPDTPQNETRPQSQRGLVAHLNSPLSSWPTQLNPGVGPTGWISYLGMRPLPDQQEEQSSSAGHRSPKALLASYEQDHDLVRLMPSLAVIDALLDYYFEHCTWLHRPVDSVAFMRRWSNYKSGIWPCRITLATACVLLATAVFHLPDGYSVSPGQPPVRSELGTRCYNIALMLMERHGPSTPGRDLDRIELLLARSFYLALVTVDSEELWLLRAELVAVGTALGLHRDPGTWGLPNITAERRRMAWWNIVFLDRWHAFMFGRPYAISSRLFDTQLPVAYNTMDDKSSPVYTVHVLLFRLAYLMGELLDATFLRRVPYGTILDHDRLLQEWLEALPADIVMDDVTLAQSITAPLAATRRAGVQGAALRLAFLHVRFALHRAHTGGTGALCGEAPEMANSMALAVDAASALLTTGTQLHPTSLGPHAANVVAHLSSLPQHVCAAAVFLTLLIAENPTRLDFQPLRSSVAHAAADLTRFVGRPFADKALNVLRALEPAYAEPPVQDDEKAQALRTANALARARAVVFLAQQPYTPVTSPQPGWQPESSVSPEVLPPPVVDISHSPQILWAPGRNALQNPPRKRARLQGPTSLMSSTSFSTPATPKGDLSSYVMSPAQHPKQHIHSQQDLQGHATGPSPQSASVLNFEQSSGLPAFKVPNTNQDSLWSGSIGFEKSELGQFFEDMDEGKRVA
ncbi:fungal-specific transcription factor domain-containing protein [Russula earlei]|uniref:Fungal-specific transcription factor domain-containing protein n=1 Tax=Russula earlei TaxID=71964 RepID=A0ACC0TYK2_9AGAM|nr:fungal-specific transcription factor domain-containing protein [Russula earlei]